MKKLLLIFAVAVAAACTKVPQGGEEPEIDPNAPTTFVFIHNFKTLVFPNCIAGYYADGLCLKIADLGDMVKGVPTPEITLTDDAITEISLFTDYVGGVVFRRSFPIVKHTKNVFELREDDYSNEVDKEDPSQWPR
jgi:hypothetical protein